MDLRVLLFSSMVDTTGMYLSNETRDIVKVSSKFKKLKISISNAIDNKLTVKRRNSNQGSIDNEIEKAMNNEIGQEQEKGSFLAKLLDYSKRDKSPVDEIKLSLKNLYSTFVSYAKSTYSEAFSSTKKVVEGPVKITMLKLIRVYEYILTALNPQWNKVPGSPDDLDSLAPAITNHISDSESAKYSSSYSVIKYRTG